MNHLLQPATVATHRTWLEISRGKTSFRARPIPQGRFLIGAGSTCHLQLGGSDVPMVHSLILSRGDQLTIESLVPHPPLLVNERPCRTSALQDGDTVRIGSFVFTIHQQAMTQPAHEETCLAECDSSREFEPDPSEMSALELVNQISEMEEMVQEMEQAREAGARSLLQAVRSAGKMRSAAAVQEPELPRLTQALAQLADQVVSQAEAFARREQAWEQALMQLQENQQRIIAQLSGMSRSAQHEADLHAERASA